MVNRLKIKIFHTDDPRFALIFFTDGYDIELRPTTFGNLCLPLSENGANVSHILAGLYPRK